MPVLRIAELAWLCFALVMLLSTLVGFARGSDIASRIGVGALIGTTIFPIAVAPCVATFRFGLRLHAWLLVSLALGAAYVGFVAAYIAALCVRSIAYNAASAWRVGRETYYLLLIGFNEGLHHALSLLGWAVLLCTLAWSAVLVRPHHVLFSLCVVGGAIAALFLVVGIASPIWR